MKMFMLLVICVVLSSCTTRQTLKTDGPMEVASATFSNDKGESFHDAVVVGGVKNPYEGVAAEYRYISGLHGQRGQDWFLVGQTVIQNQNRIVDVVEIQLNDPAFRKVIFFDATSYLLRD
ncbi:MAG: hypothetical protein JW913_18255 [Chitinispirillaceae bacterium]|nr:hypothetical protein [Chitinispirillaceae bacterium]